jgi:hypothetical protein
MEGHPSHFEAIGSRLGFRVAREDQGQIVLAWRGARFPAFLCLGIAVALSFISVPIVEALRQRGFVGPAGSLWYFPLMNLILLGIAGFLLSMKRTITLDKSFKTVTLKRRNLFRVVHLKIGFDEIFSLRLGSDEVYSGFAVGGSTAAQTYPVPSLRLVLKNNETVLLDRGGMKRLEGLAQRLAEWLDKPCERKLSGHSSIMSSRKAPDAAGRQPS